MIKVRFKARSLTQAMREGKSRFILLTECLQYDRRSHLDLTGTMNEFVIIMPESAMVSMKLQYSDLYVITQDG